MAKFLNAHAMRETEKAIHCRLIDEQMHWVPLFQIESNSEVKHRGDKGILITNDWWPGAARVAHLVGLTEPPSESRQKLVRDRDIDEALPPHRLCPTCGQPMPLTYRVLSALMLTR
jgi:hypothetical protein